MVLEIFLLLLAALGLLVEAKFFRSTLKLRESARQKTGNDFTPKVSLIVPFKGVDQGMGENIKAFLSQDYPDYEVIFVSHSREDPSFKLLKELLSKHQKLELLQKFKSAKILVRDEKYKDCSFKVASQLTAVREAKGEVLAFADSDVRPGRDWLGNLVAPLANKEIGASTSTIWYVPEIPFAQTSKEGTAENSFEQNTKGSMFWTCLMSAWNSSAGLSLTQSRKRNFIRGCSFAIRKEKFEELGMEKIWEKEITDDASLTVRMKQEGSPIKFVPRAIVPAFEGFDREKVSELTTRWVRIVRHYDRKAIRFAFLIYGISVATLAAGILSFAFGFPGIGIVLLLPQAVSLLRSWLRFKLAEDVLPEWKGSMSSSKAKIILSEFFVKFLVLYNIVKTRGMKSIIWRGREYFFAGQKSG